MYRYFYESKKFLVVVQSREKKINWKKNTEDDENLFFKALAKRF